MDKDHILEEIRRTAAANGGTPLGQQAFASETGIRKTGWYGKLWARWSDALTEAGFAPNRLTPAIDERVLLERYIELGLRLGRLPTEGDIRLESRTDGTFPSHTTFARLGSKVSRASRVVQTYGSRPDCTSVIAQCREILAQEEKRLLKDKHSATPGQDEEGEIYLIKSGRYFKIGRTNAVGRREREITLQLPERAATVLVIRTDDPVGIEAYWHKRFEAKRKNGEWFELTSTDVAAFKRRKFM